MSSEYQIDKRQVRKAFDRAARQYDEAAVLQREVGQRMIDALAFVRLKPQTILDIGAGTGLYSQLLKQRYPKAQVISADIAPGMLQVARERNQRWWRPWSASPRQSYLCADIEHLPLADASVDMIFSNLTVQWCQDLEGMFRECRRVLRPGGLMTFSSFGPDTLKELRSSWQAVDGHVHVNAFMDMHDVGDAMVRAQLAEPVMNMEYFTLTYDAVRGLMQDLKAIGAHNINQGRAKGMTGKTRLKAMTEAYEQFRRDGKLPATYEVVYGHAWAPEKGMQQQQHDDETRISIQQMRLAVHKGKV